MIKEVANVSEKRVVLVLEDLRNWQDTVRLLLEAERDKDGEEIYQVIAADSLGSAITLLHSQVFDVVIVDICLTEGDITNTKGMTFLDELGKHYADDHTHVIMLSGHGTIALAVDAIKRSYVVDYIQKDPGLFDEDRFVSEVAHAWRLTETQRAEQVGRQLHPLSPSVINAFEISRLVASLAPEMDAVTAARDLESLLENLLPKFLPLAQGAHVTVEPAENDTKPSAHILCWSRRLGRALDITIGLLGSLDSFQCVSHWQNVSSSEKLLQRSSQYFDSTVFGLPEVSFEWFLSVAVPAS